MKQYNVAILGATGAVGREMLRVLEEYGMPVGRLVPLAGKKGAGKTVRFHGEDIPVKEAGEESFEGADFVLGAVKSPVSRRFAPYIVKSGAVFIDNSSAFRADESVPLVIPEINGEDAFLHRGIIANPNCSTVITMMSVAGIARLSPIVSITASTYQAVSGAGQAGFAELEEQTRAYLSGAETEPRVFPRRIAMNVIPFIGEETANGYTDEEMKLQNEGRRILHSPRLAASCTCVRVPVMRSHSISVSVKTAKKLALEDVKAAVAAFPGCALTSDFPTPVDAEGRDTVLVGRIREDIGGENRIALWCCGDQLRKGAAANAVQIMRLFV